MQVFRITVYTLLLVFLVLCALWAHARNFTDLSFGLSWFAGIFMVLGGIYLVFQEYN